MPTLPKRHEPCKQCGTPIQSHRLMGHTVLAVPCGHVLTPPARRGIKSRTDWAWLAALVNHKPIQPLEESLQLRLPGYIGHNKGRKVTRATWRTARQWRMHAYEAVRYATPWRPALPLIILLTRIAPRPLDSDNVLLALSPVRDGVTNGLGLTNDAMQGLTWQYRQCRGEYGVGIALIPGASQ